MKKYDISNHESFMKIKDELMKELEKVIFLKLTQMGDDIKGITWFYSPEYYSRG